MEDSEEKDNSKSILFYKRNLSEVPCFRKSFMTGIMSGIGLGVGHFMATSKPQTSYHVAFGSFTLITLGVWFNCRYHWTAERIRERQFKDALRIKEVEEGSESVKLPLPERKDLKEV
ncbi:hypothetical protein SNE40_011103 [Patella caerulea]|uniref:Cytochrome c oxidase assembly protein COX20, mitochondrial n=1 Tax=Patella caerulea TaxID=87958 RepID=A0AAN8PSE9_PATCE